LLPSLSLFFFLPPRPPPPSTLFPYTTLFRSLLPLGLQGPQRRVAHHGRHAVRGHRRASRVSVLGRAVLQGGLRGDARDRSREDRSEEHTSELQSHLNLVCRLLLEKKKKMTKK